MQVGVSYTSSHLKGCGSAAAVLDGDIDSAVAEQHVR